MKVVCQICGEGKESTDFYRAGAARQKWCKLCDNARKRDWYKRTVAAEGREMRTTPSEMSEHLQKGKKKCPKCKTVKALKAFSKSRNPGHAGGRAPHCKLCAKEIQPEVAPEARHLYYQNRKSRQRNRHLKRCFGISLDEYNLMLSAQNGLCAICGGIDSGKQLAVDHCHTTLKVRSLLCGRCNPAVGFVRTAQIARKIAEYLEKYGG